MSLRQEIETWISALAHYDNNEYDGALLAFKEIADTSKILFNCGVIYATLGEHGQAVECYQRAVQFDQFLAVAYFQQGVSNFLLGDFEEALANFNDTLLYLRGNRFIDYVQLGLGFKLHSCEALFNRGLCYFYLQQREAAAQDLLFASREKAVSDHSVIDEAIRDTAQGYTVFSIPVGILYRPNAAKVKNLQAKDYLGRARLIAQHQDGYGHTRTYLDGRRQLSLQDLSLDDRREDASYAATHLVKPGLASRSRLQSEPPLNRSVFPPTPPPEPERQPWSTEDETWPLDQERLQLQHSRHHRSVSTSEIGSSPQSIKHSDQRRERSTSRQRKPGRLDLGVAAFKHASPKHTNNSEPDAKQQHTRQSRPQKPRLTIGTQRSTSETPLPSLRKDSAIALDSHPFSAQETDTRTSRFSAHSLEKRTLLPLSISESATESPAFPPQRDSPRSALRRRGRQRPHSLEDDLAEEDEPETVETPGTASASGGESGGGALRFEMVAGAGADRVPERVEEERLPPMRRHTSVTRGPSRTRGGSTSRFRGDGDWIRVKLHAEETRFVLISADTGFAELVECVKGKLRIERDIKIRMRDEEGDLVLLGDQEDWEMAVEGCRRGQVREWDRGRAAVLGEGGEVGKLDLWIS